MRTFWGGVHATEMVSLETVVPGEPPGAEPEWNSGFGIGDLRSLGNAVVCDKGAAFFV